MSMDDRIEKWGSQGILEPSRILARIEAEDAIKPAAEKLPTGTSVLDAAAFVSLLHTKGHLPQSCLSFGRLVYGVIAYLSTAPFYHQPGEQAPSSLTLTEIYRGVAWILPEIYQRITVAGNWSRLRTAADHRRLLFQSLASTTHDGPHDAVKARQRALRNAHCVVDPFYDDPDWLSVNCDDDGDEMYHDVLDVLYATQPDPNYPVGPVKRDSFREFAKTLPKSHPKFHTLAIPLDRFVIFVTFLLALQFEHQAPGEPIPAQFEEAAKNLAAACCEDEKTDIITWPKFDDALKEMPFLFDPLYRLLSAAFLQGAPFSVSGDWLAPKPPKDSFMTLPLLSQLATMLNQDVDFENFGRAHQWHTGVRPTAGVLVSAMKTMPDLSILAIYGLSPTGVKYVFGIFSPVPSKPDDHHTEEETDEQESDEEQHAPVVREQDAVHDWVEHRGHIKHVARPLLFVLGPAQRVVRVNQEPRVVEDGLHFEDALKILNDGTAQIKVGGNWDVVVKTKAIEIWGETSART